ncbi:MAG TPA: hypothetical protein VGM50_22530 [Gemmatimonadaceae bacterium]
MAAPQPQDWTRRFLELAADAGRGYDRVLRRYNELLTRVADGDLSPDAVQNEFRLFLTEQSTTSTRELVEASVGLLAGLVYIEARYREAMLEGLLPHEGVVPPPPSPASVDVANWFETLSKYAAEQSAHNVARQQRLMERVASGDITVERINEQSKRYLAETSPHFIGEVVELGMKFAGKMQHSSTTFAEGLYDRILGAEHDARTEIAPILDLRGASGDEVMTSFVIENSRAMHASVVCSMSEFVSRTNGAPISAGEVFPSRFVLAPGEAQDISVRVSLSPELFVPETDYFGMLRIAGAGERETIVQVIAHADPVVVNA